MWGYIGFFSVLERYVFVPSLYVRVYRWLFGGFDSILRSLIICEGISGKSINYTELTGFPHYMWGYIDNGDMIRFIIFGSIIICEGISHFMRGINGHARFPHYMWGYIVLGLKDKALTSVPSLYVRVYRYLRPIRCQTPSSLTTYECISKSAMASFRHQKI